MAEHKKKRQVWSNRIQYEQYRLRLGECAPKSFASFLRTKEMGGETWAALRQDFRAAIEGQRKRKGGNLAYNVNWDMVNTPEWNAKFDGISSFGGTEGSREADDRIRELSRRILLRRDGTNLEDAYIVDLKTGKTVGANVWSNTSGSVGVTEKTRKVYYRDYPDGGLVGIHNHPNSSTPSDEDLSMIADRPGQDLSVVPCHDGSVIVFTKPKDYDTMETYSDGQEHKTIRSKYSTYFTDAKFTFIKSERESHEYAIMEVAADYGFQYKRL